MTNTFEFTIPQRLNLKLPYYTKDGPQWLDVDNYLEWFSADITHQQTATGNTHDLLYQNTVLVQDHVLMVAYLNNVFWELVGGFPPKDVVFEGSGTAGRMVIDRSDSTT